MPPRRHGTSAVRSPFVELAHAGLISGAVLDAGCGTGEHAMMAAAMRLEAHTASQAKASVTSTMPRLRRDSLRHEGVGTTGWLRVGIR
jgi:hypothetical protein